MRSGLLLLFYVCITSVKAQKEANTWYFQAGLGIDFNQCPPAVLHNGSRLTWENACSISDPETGRLLFYTNTGSVFNRNHSVMKNGALPIPGGYSSTQVAIVPHPHKDSSNLFFIFTSPAQASKVSDSLRYYIVDMTKDGGLGAVTTRGSLLKGPLNEKVVAIRAPDKKSFWLITHSYLTNLFYAFRITESGLNPVPVSSAIGPVNNGNCQSYLSNIGSLVASPDGSKLAYLNLCDKSFQLYRFNFSDGTLSSYLNITSPNLLNPVNNPSYPGGFYGGSFSPDSRLLYITTMEGNAMDASAAIYQFDIASWNKTLIEQSVYPVSLIVNPENNVYTNYKHLKLGPDGKLYIAMVKYYTGLKRDSLSKSPVCFPVIHHPDVKGPGCGFDTCYLSVASQYGESFSYQFGTWCLNNLFEINDYPKKSKVKGIVSHIPCKPSVLHPASPILRPALTQYLWSDSSATDSIVTDKLQPSYWVDIITPDCDTIRDSFIRLKPKRLIGKKQSACIRQLVSLGPLSDTTDVKAYRWNTGIQASEITITRTGIYWLDLIRDCDTTRDSFNILQPLRLKGKDTSMCIGKGRTLIPLSGINTRVTYSWNNGSKDSFLKTTIPGIYWLDIISDCDTVRDSFSIPRPLRVNGKHAYTCTGNGQTLLPLSAVTNGVAYSWNNGSKDSFLKTTIPGIYWLDIISDCDTTRDSFTLLPRVYRTGTNKHLCPGGILYPSVQDTAARYRWSTGATAKSLSAGTEGTYWVDITMPCYFLRDSFNIARVQQHGLFSANDTILCGNTILYTVHTDTGLYKLLWHDGSRGSSKPIASPGRYVFTILSKDSCLWDTGSVSVTQKANIPVFIENAFSPDGNAINDFFPASAYMTPLSYFSLEIYSRWGEKLYSAEHSGWDGTYKQAPCAEGIYLYKITYIDCDYSAKHLSGTVQLIR